MNSLIFSHDGFLDRATNLSAPPHFYAHVDRMIARSQRNSSELTVLRLALDENSSGESILHLAHAISQVMRQEDLCGRLGIYEFIIAISGNLEIATKVIERICTLVTFEFSAAASLWAVNEGSLELFHRLDRTEVESYPHI